MIDIKYKKNLLFVHMCMCVCNYVNLENKWFDMTEKKNTCLPVKLSIYSLNNKLLLCTSWNLI